MPARINGNRYLKKRTHRNAPSLLSPVILSRDYLFDRPIPRILDELDLELPPEEDDEDAEDLEDEERDDIELEEDLETGLLGAADRLEPKE